MNDNDDVTNIVKISDYMKSKTVANDNIEEIDVDISEEVRKIITQMNHVDETCSRWWNDGIAPQHRLMAFYYIANQLFTAMMLEDVESMSDFVHNYLKLPYDDETTLSVIDSSAFGVVWDTLLEGKRVVSNRILD